MTKEKEFKERFTTEIKNMVWDFKRVVSNVLILVGLYYLLVSARIIKTSVIWFVNSPIQPTPKNIFIVAVIMIILGLLLNKEVFRRLKNAFQ